MKKTIIMALAASLMAVPAQAQTLGDQVRDIKGSVNRLFGRKAPVAAATSANAPATQDGADGAELITAASLGDDTSRTMLSSAPTRPRDVSTFDILGFKLGMAPSEVQAIARRKGIRAKYPNVAAPYTGDFDLEATRIANRQLSRKLSDRSKRMLSQAFGLTSDGSAIDFAFTLTPDGPRLSSIDYTTKDNGQTDEQLRKVLMTRFGKSDQDIGYQQQWCGGSGCGTASNNFDQFLVYHSGGTVMMNLHRSNAYSKAADAALNARAAQIAGNTGGKTNF